LGFATIIGATTPHVTSIVDLGSGGGIPGLILAEVFPEAIVTLLDGRSSRVELLREFAEILGWGYRLQIIGERAEEFARIPGSREAYQIVVARGFGRPAAVAECAAPLLAPGGSLIVSEPPSLEASEARWDRPTLGALGLDLHFERANALQYARLERIGVCPPQYPRRVGIPEKRPLF
jgi:16S rRNA (guanine527-N7)-methyltransferase